MFKKGSHQDTHPQPTAHTCSTTYFPEGILQLGPPHPDKCRLFWIYLHLHSASGAGCLIGITQILAPEAFVVACSSLGAEYSI